MALQKSIDLNYGVTLEKAYIKVDRLEAYKDYANIHISIFASKEARDAGKPPINQIVKKVDRDNSDFVSLVYNALKSDQEFSDATDC